MTAVRFPVGVGTFSLHLHVQTASGPTQTPIQWVPGIFFPMVNRPGRRVDHSVPPNAETSVKMSGAIPPLSNRPSWRGA